MFGMLDCEPRGTKVNRFIWYHSDGKPCTPYTYVYYWEWIFHLFYIVSLRTRIVRTNAKEVDKGRPSRHNRRGSWRAFKVFFAAGVDKTISRVFSVRLSFSFSVFSNVSVFSPSCISLKTARLARSLDSLCRNRLGVHHHSSVPRAACHACTALRRCVMRRFFLKEKQAARANCLVQMSVLLLSHSYLVENGMACPKIGFPVQGQIWGTLSSKYGRAACRAPCATCACPVCHECICRVQCDTFFV